MTKEPRELGAEVFIPKSHWIERAEKIVRECPQQKADGKVREARTRAMVLIRQCRYMGECPANKSPEALAEELSVARACLLQLLTCGDSVVCREAAAALKQVLAAGELDQDSVTELAQIAIHLGELLEHPSARSALREELLEAYQYALFRVLLCNERPNSKLDAKSAKRILAQATALKRSSSRWTKSPQAQYAALNAHRIAAAIPSIVTAQLVDTTTQVTGVYPEIKKSIKTGKPLNPQAQKEVVDAFCGLLRLGDAVYAQFDEEWAGLIFLRQLYADSQGLEGEELGPFIEVLKRFSEEVKNRRALRAAAVGTEPGWWDGVRDWGRQVLPKSIFPGGRNENATQEEQWLVDYGLVEIGSRIMVSDRVDVSTIQEVIQLFENHLSSTSSWRVKGKLLSTAAQLETNHPEQAGRVREIADSIKLLPQHELSIRSAHFGQTRAQKIKARAEILPVSNISDRLHPDANFTNRENTLQRLHHRLRAQGDHLLIVQGPAGAGKKALALEYARMNSPVYSRVFHVRAHNKTIFFNDLMRIVKILGLQFTLSGDEDSVAPEDIVRRLKVWFEEEGNQSYLLIINDVDQGAPNPVNMAVLSEFLPQRGGDIIVTTQSKLEGQPPIQLQGLHEEEAVGLLLTAMKKESNDDLKMSPLDARRLIKRIEGIPGRILQEAKRIAREGLTIGEYLKEYDAQKKKLFAERPLAPEDAGSVVWHMMYDRIRRQGGLAYPTLCASAFLAGNPFTREELKLSVVIACQLGAIKDNFVGTDFGGAFRTLFHTCPVLHSVGQQADGKRLFAVDRVHSDRVMHTLTQENVDQLDAYASAATLMAHFLQAKSQAEDLELAIARIETKLSNFRYPAVLQANSMEKVLDQPCAEERELLDPQSEPVSTLGAIVGMETAEKAARLVKRGLTSTRAKSISNESNGSPLQGRLQNELLYLKEGKSQLNELTGKVEGNFPDKDIVWTVASILHANVLRQQANKLLQSLTNDDGDGGSGTAPPSQRPVINDASFERLAESIPDGLVRSQNILHTYEQSLDAGEQRRSRIRKVREKVASLSFLSQQTLFALSAIRATNLESLIEITPVPAERKGLVDELSDFFEPWDSHYRMAKPITTVFPAEFPLSFIDSSKALIHQGKYRRAEEYLKNTEKQIIEFYKGRPSVPQAEVLNQLAIAARHRGKYDTSLSYAERALAVSNQVRDSKASLSEARALNNIGIAYERKGEYTKALAIEDQALGILTGIFKKRPSLDVALVYISSGIAQNGLGNFDDGIMRERRAIKMLRSLSQDRPTLDWARALSNLGVLQERRGDYNEALLCNQRAIQMYNEVLDGHDHRDLAHAFVSTGATLLGHNRPEESIEYGHRGLEMFQRIHGGISHTEIGIPLLNIGCAYDQLGRHGEALDYQLRALKTFQGVYPDRPHPFTANALDSIGVTLRHQKRYDMAIERHREALALFKQAYPKGPHSDIANALKELAMDYEEKGSVKLALEFYSRATQEYEKLGIDGKKEEVEACMQRVRARR